MTSAIVCLGKAGDIISALPIARHFAIGDWIVHASYQHVLYGVSYVHPAPLHCSVSDVKSALKYAAEQGYEQVLMAQTYGKHWAGRRDISFNEGAWLNCGLTSDEFHDTDRFPLLFDRRDQAREQLLVNQHIRGKKPLLVLAVACGRSSPFGSHWIFSNAIRTKWGNIFEILNLCDVKAARIYDLLGILERARVIISGDSFPLHLAAACTTPVIALVNDKPWCATTSRRACLLRMPYREVIPNMRRIHEAIASVLHVGKRANSR